MYFIVVMKVFVFLMGVGFGNAADFGPFDCTLYPTAHVTEFKLVQATTPATGIDATFTFKTAATVSSTKQFTVFLHYQLESGITYKYADVYFTDGKTEYLTKFNFNLFTDLSKVVAFTFHDFEAVKSIQVGSFAGGLFTSSGVTIDSFKIEKSNDANADYHYAQTKDSTCANPIWKHASIALISGDPHIRTWNGDKYDFMGGCTLVLIENVALSTGDRLDIHIRTVVEKWWSYISAVAFRIESVTFEVSTKDGRLFVNGEENGSFKFLHPTLKIQSYQQNVTSLGHFHFTHVLLDDDVDVLHVNGVHGEKQEMSVMLHSAGVEAYSKSLGLMGVYPTGELVGRDGVTVFENTTEFAEHWQVKKEFDPVLFSSQFGDSSDQCVYPTETQGQSLVSKEIAMTVCRNKEGEEMCVEDVMASGDFELGYLYVDSLQGYEVSVDENEAMKACSDAGEFVSLCVKEVLAMQDVTIGEEFKMFKMVQ